MNRLGFATNPSVCRKSYEMLSGDDRTVEMIITGRSWMAGGKNQKSELAITKICRAAYLSLELLYTTNICFLCKGPDSALDAHLLSAVRGDDADVFRLCNILISDTLRIRS